MQLPSFLKMHPQSVGQIVLQNLPGFQPKLSAG